MEWRTITSLNDLVEIMHVNGRLMPGPQPMPVSPETRALVRSIFRPLPASVPPDAHPPNGPPKVPSASGAKPDAGANPATSARR
jgi:hypothetical protein